MNVTNLKEGDEMEAMYWLIGVVVLLAIELLTMGLTTIWFAGGSLAAFVVTLLGGGRWIQIIVFLVVSFVLLFFTRPVAAKYFNKQRTKTNAEGLIGKEAKVTADIDNFNQKGTVMVDGMEWSARTENDSVIEKGKKVEILEIKGVKLIVREKGE